MIPGVTSASYFFQEQQHSYSTSVMDVIFFPFCLLLFCFVKETDSSRMIEKKKKKRRKKKKNIALILS